MFVLVTFTIKNESPHVLKANGSTKISGQLEAYLPDIESGELQKFIWKNHGGFSAAIVGVIHYAVGDTGRILNIMVSINSNFNLREAFSNIRICRWNESYKRLRHGKGGCSAPVKGSNCRRINKCEFVLTASDPVELKVTFRHDDGADPESSCLLKGINFNFTIINDSFHVLLPIGSTRSSRLLDVYLPDVLQNTTKKFTWSKFHAIMKLGGGVVHYHIGNTGTILNLMISIGPNLSLLDCFVNVRVCNWMESFNNLRYGKGGCHKPESDSITFDNGFNISLTNSETSANSNTLHTENSLSFSVKYRYDERAAFPISHVISSNIIDAHFQYNNGNAHSICCIVNKSTSKLIAETFCIKSGILVTEPKDIKPNETHLLVFREKRNIDLFGASGIFYYKIDNSDNYLNILADLCSKQGRSLCNVAVLSYKPAFKEFCCDRTNQIAMAGNMCLRRGCEFMLSKRKRATFLVVFKGIDMTEEITTNDYKCRETQTSTFPQEEPRQTQTSFVNEIESRCTQTSNQYEPDEIWKFNIRQQPENIKSQAIETMELVQMKIRNEDASKQQSNLLEQNIITVEMSPSLQFESKDHLISSPPDQIEPQHNAAQIQLSDNLEIKVQIIESESFCIPEIDKKCADIETSSQNTEMSLVNSTETERREGEIQSPNIRDTGNLQYRRGKRRQVHTISPP